MSVKIWLVTKELKELEMSNSKRDTAFEQLPTEEIKKLRMRACKRELLPSRSCLQTRQIRSSARRYQLSGSGPSPSNYVICHRR